MKSIATLTITLILTTYVFAEAENYMEGYEKTLIYENNFNRFEDMDDWVFEGPGKKYLAGGKMLLIPDAQQAVYSKWEQADRKRVNAKEYYAAVVEALKEHNPDMLDKIQSLGGNFAGGHIVCWNKAFETSENFIVEYDFMPLSPIGLGIVFFSAKGANGEDIFSDSLKSRYGVFSQYIISDINCYHISYWANATGNIRGTSNLRKNSGAFCLANGIDPSVDGFDYNAEEFNFKTHRIRLVKIENNIKFYIDDVLSIDYTDKRFNNIVSEEGIDIVKEKDVDTGEVLGGGRVGLRQMVDLMAAYDNIRVYNLQKKK